MPSTGEELRPTAAFDAYWRFAAERQRVFFRRLRGEPPPWTDDAIIAANRFTNPYRATDRVSQYLISRVIRRGDQSREELLFRILLFKLFNKISTWEWLEKCFGVVEWRSFDRSEYECALAELKSEGRSLYSAAYMMPSPQLGEATKHADHLKLVEYMMLDGLADKLATCDSLEQSYKTVKSYPSMGSFLAFQMAIDVNYSSLTSFDEDSFVVAGPGALDGLKKCFGDFVSSPEAVIAEVTNRAPEELSRRGFETLFGRELKLIDCQNLFCETSKYTRLSNPEIAGASGRTKIKQRYIAVNVETLAELVLPEKWCLDDRVREFYAELRRDTQDASADDR